MRELGALMNSMVGVDPDDDVAVLMATLNCVRTLRTTELATQQSAIQRRCGALIINATCRVPMPALRHIPAQM